jgi:thioredoxin 2
MMAPHFEAAAKGLEPGLRFAKVDTDAEPELGARFGIRSIPTLVLFRAGREIARQSGAMTREQLIKWIGTVA